MSPRISAERARRRFGNAAPAGPGLNRHPGSWQRFGTGRLKGRLSEERGAKASLARLETLDIDSAEFDSRFLGLRASVVAHAEPEERDEFVRLAGLFDAPKLARMRKAVEIAEAIAPTRPHAGVESPLANMVVGPFASMMDRARDALAAKR